MSGPGQRRGDQGDDRGALALVLHSHMPYVEGFDTWPFGEEWLWEALARVYLPLLDRIRGAPVTLGLTPVLCDQLETLTGDAGERFMTYLAEVKPAIHAEDAEALERAGDGAGAAELRRAARDYTWAASAFEQLGRDPLAALAQAAANGSIWSSAATHALLPQLATEPGLQLQIAGVAGAHERRFGGFSGGFWLPECAYEPGLERDLAEVGVRAFCVDQTEQLGLGSLDQLEPIATASGPVAVPIDWETVNLVWDSARGYPAAGAYRDYHRTTNRHLRPWSNTGETYRREQALALAREHARDFVERVGARLDRYRAERDRAGLVCCALDTELLGYWWYEGGTWLAAVLEEARRQGVTLAALPDALEQIEPVERLLAASTWGTGRDLRTWDAPEVVELVAGARRAELRIVAEAARARPGAAGDDRAALARAARELLAAQASDWPFLVTRELASPYALGRARGHLDGVDEALAALADSRPVPEPSVRNLAPELDLSPLTAP